MAFKAKLKTSLPGIFSIISRYKQIFLGMLIAHQKKLLVTKIESYYKGDADALEIISFLKSNPVEMIPYLYRKEYEKKRIEVKFDSIEDLYVVKVNGNDIYFPKEMTTEYIVDSVRVGLIEQDERSPHKYLPIGSMNIGGDVAILCGASDCMYALQIIGYFKKIYLFEANTAWIKPIKRTLRDYLHKIEIVPYFISDKNSTNTVTIDSFFKNKREEVNYIQADIEGDELKMLRGCEQLLNQATNLKLALCCYHTAQQEKELTEMLVGKGFSISSSKGFLLMWMQYPLKPPYLRKGVLYAIK